MTDKKQNSATKAHSDPHTTFWQDCWQNAHTPWDLSREHPYCEDLLSMAEAEAGLRPPAAIWVPGCGRGHEARFLAGRGFRVLGEDLVPSAIVEAKKLPSHGELTFSVGDVLERPKEQEGSFDAVFDRAMLCALHEKYRSLYKESCFYRLKPGGFFMGILFKKVADEVKGPPFAVAFSELLSLWQEGFSLVALSERAAPYKEGVILEEYLVILRRHL